MRLFVSWLNVGTVIATCTGRAKGENGNWMPEFVASSIFLNPIRVAKLSS